MRTVADLEPIAYVGVDWASEEHAVCVLDAAGRKTSSFPVAHSRNGFELLVRRLAALGPAGEVPVAIERPDGRLVDALLEAGHPVVPVSPNAIKAWRESEVISGAKDDPGDAEVIAEYLRLRSHKLTVVAPFSGETRALRAVVRVPGDLGEQRVAAHNQLEACLDAFWPGAKVIFADVTSEIALAFLERYPTPGSGRSLGERRLQAFLTKHGYCGRRPAGELLERLRSAPEGIGDGPEAEGRRDAVLGYVRVIRALNASIKALDRSVAAHLGEHPDAERACDKRFRQAMTTFADNSRHASPWAAAVYQAAIDRGCDHPHAVRVLARAWIRVIWRCWQDRVPYDPTKHGAALRLLAPPEGGEIEEPAA